MSALKVIDMFSGIGSASFGFAKAGLEIAGALDVDAAACQQYESNLGIRPIHEDVRRVSGRQILEKASLKRGEPDIVVGCPPCQGFSSLGRTRRKKGTRDYRNSLVRIFADRIAEMLPRSVVFENVPGMAAQPYRRYLLLLVRRLESLGYLCAFEIIRAEKFGVPQKRRRVILVAVRDPVEGPLLPAPTHLNPLTVRHAIGTLRKLKAGEKDPDDSLHSAPDHGRRTLNLIKKIPKNGGSRIDLPRRMWLSCHRELETGAGSVYGRMRWEEPSPTITTRSDHPSTGRFIHPDQDRGISAREAARLQSIPDAFKIRGSKGDISAWIGNAMPTRLGEVMGSHLKALLA